MEPNTRYLCSILDNMRACYKTRNFSSLIGLIEEAQYRAERMEAAIEGYQEIGRNEERRIELKKEIADLKKLKKDLECGN